MLNWKQFAQLRYLFLLPVFLGLFISIYIKNNLDGLPIDDAYIYMQYVENISAGHGYSFNPGEVSFGATSFLFTVMVSMVNIFLPGMTPLTALQWTGIFWFLVCIVMVQVILWRQTQNIWFCLAGGFLIAGCHVLLFTAPAGLEASMFCALSLCLIYALMYAYIHPIWLGMLAGIVFLTRPEGLLILFSFILFYLLSFLIHPTKDKEIRSHIKYSLFLLLGLVISIIPYMLFVKINSGYWLPTTYYGKILHQNVFINMTLLQRIEHGFATVIRSIVEITEQDPTALTYYLLYLLTFILILIYSFRLGQHFPNRRYFAYFSTILALIVFLPFLYGFKFKLYQQFGGYYVRYIQLVLILVHITGLIALHELCKILINWFTDEQTKHRAYLSISIALASIITFYALPYLRKNNFEIPSFVKLHTQVNEGVRKQAGLWIKKNTPLNSKIMAGTTGLGVVGAYCDRYVYDEAGLINPDIHPYLKTYANTFGHAGYKLEAQWYSILEYMARNNIDYYTALRPLAFDTRFTKLVTTVTDPALFDTELSDHAEIKIYNFDPQTQYNLWSDFEPYLTFEDRAENPINEGRVKLTFWDQIPVIAVDTRMVKSEIRGEYVFPDNAVFKAGLALDYPERDYSGEWIEFEVEVETFRNRETMYKKRIPIAEFSPRQILKTIEVDLSKYSHQYGELIISLTSAPKKEPSVLWAGWVDPILKRKNSS